MDFGAFCRWLVAELDLELSAAEVATLRRSTDLVDGLGLDSFDFTMLALALADQAGAAEEAADPPLTLGAAHDLYVELLTRAPMPTGDPASAS